VHETRSAVTTVRAAAPFEQDTKMYL
jgi:hypothetical protein